MRPQHPWQDTFALLSGARLPERRPLGEQFDEDSIVTQTVPVSAARSGLLRRLVRRLAWPHLRRQRMQEPAIATDIKAGK